MTHKFNLNFDPHMNERDLQLAAYQIVHRELDVFSLKW